MTKAQAIRDFKILYSESLASTFKTDLPARREAWSMYTDSLQRCGDITENQYATWTQPSFISGAYPKRKPRIMTLDVEAKEWFDRSAGNSYFSAVVTVNCGMMSEQSLTVPFQYGYGDHYRDTAFKALQNQRIIKGVEKNESYWRFYQRKNIIARHSIHETSKRNVVSWGFAS